MKRCQHYSAPSDVSIQTRIGLSTAHRQGTSALGLDGPSQKKNKVVLKQSK